MKKSNYLPSAHFVSVTSALLLAGGLVYAAEYVNTPKTPGYLDITSNIAAQNNQDWEATLNSIQGKSASSSLPAAPTQAVVEKALQDVKNGNFTDTVGRSLLIGLVTAKDQGLGNDIPTQQKIIEQALQQIQQTQKLVYSKKDLSIVSSSAIALHNYGNSVMSVMQKHPSAKVMSVYLAVDSLMSKGDASQLQKLASISKEYSALANELSTVQTTDTLAPLHLIIINDIEAMAEQIAGMEKLPTDLLQGVTALQKFGVTLSETDRVFTSIAQQLKKSGILFTSDEHGSAWSDFLPS